MTNLSGRANPVFMMRQWPARRWVVAALMAAGTTAAIAIPTDLINTPLFTREIPPTWWSWPALLVSAALAGLLVATYVAQPPTGPLVDRPGPGRGGYIGGMLTFFAVGCPVCNKLVLLALGTSGAMTWFEPLQPLLQILGIALLIWALLARLRGEQSCPVDHQTGRSFSA